MSDILTNLGPIEIQKYQQNRHPCFFLDFVDEVIPGKSAKGYKTFSYNEWFFPCHFADEPVVPGFIQVEMLTQMFLMTFLTLDGNKGKKTAFISIKDAIFKKKVVPGNRIDIIANLNKYSHGFALGTAEGYLNDELACKINLTIGIPDIVNALLPNNSK